MSSCLITNPNVSFCGCRKEVATNPGDVAVTGGDCRLNIRTPSGEMSLALPPGVALEQGSCIPTPAGETCGEEFHFRLRITASKSTHPGKTSPGYRGENPTQTRPVSLSLARLP